MIIYIIKDNNDIIGIYTELEDAYQSVIDLNNYITKKIKIKNIFNTIKIFMYKNNLIKKIFIINNKNDLIENYNYNINININKQENEILNNESSDINLFIPYNETEHETIHINDLNEKINLLEKLKLDEAKKLEELKKNYNNKEEKYLEDKIKIENKKLKLKQEQERWDSIKKKFEADKKLYYLFKNEIKENTRERKDIPLLFQDIYPIFEKLENEGYLNTVQEINEFIELTKNLDD